MSLLRRHGITDIVVTVAFLPNAIRSYFGDGSELGVSMVYATEETPLGTAGSVRNAREQLTERFLVISGDVLTDIDLTSVIAFHEKNEALATIALCSVENPLEFGIVITREDGTIERFLEKPGWGQVFSDTINTGIYVLEPEIFDRIPEGRSVDFSGEVFPAVLDAGQRLFGYVADGYWEDVGTTAAYLKAHEDILDGKVEVDVAGFELRPGVWVGKGSTIDPSVRIDSPSFIGENCTIDEDVVLGAYSTLGANTQVAPRAETQRSVIGENSYLGPATRVEGAVLGRSCDLRTGARVEPGAVVGEGCLVGAHAEVRSDVKVYPSKVVEAGAQVNASIVWESGGSRTLFGPEGVQGIANVDVSPELAVRLAKAWASGFEKGTSITASRGHQPHRPRAQARPDGRVQLGGRQRQRPGAGDGARDPTPRPHAGQPRRPDGAPQPGRPAVGGHPLLRRARHRSLRERSAAGGAYVPPRGVQACDGGGDR